MQNSKYITIRGNAIPQATTEYECAKAIPIDFPSGNFPVRVRSNFGIHVMSVFIPQPEANIVLSRGIEFETNPEHQVLNTISFKIKNTGRTAGSIDPGNLLIDYYSPQFSLAISELQLFSSIDGKEVNFSNISPQEEITVSTSVFITGNCVSYSLPAFNYSLKKEPFLLTQWGKAFWADTKSTTTGNIPIVTGAFEQNVNSPFYFHSVLLNGDLTEVSVRLRIIDIFETTILDEMVSIPASDGLTAGMCYHTFKYSGFYAATFNNYRLFIDDWQVFNGCGGINFTDNNLILE